jgi:uncharacterized protein (UPF0218 family)
LPELEIQNTVILGLNPEGMVIARANRWQKSLCRKWVK